MACHCFYWRPAQRLNIGLKQSLLRWMVLSSICNKPGFLSALSRRLFFG